MSSLTRRDAIAGISCVTAVGLAGSAKAQTSLTEAQRADYARQFATGRELEIIRNIQENRIAVPSSIKGINAYIEQSPAMVAMHAGQTPELGMLMFWNGIAMDANSLDHTAITPDHPPPTYGEQFGPTRSSRALAIVHIAMYEAVNTIYRTHASYSNLQAEILNKVGVPAAQITPATVSVKRAIIEAAYGALRGVYPNKEALFKSARENSLVLVGDTPAASALGEKIGSAASEAILKLRSQDGSFRPDLSADDFASNNGLDWHQDPVSKLKPALGGNWFRVTPFAITSADAHRPNDPPKVGDARFTSAFKAVKKLGGDPRAPTLPPRWPTETTRTGAKDEIPPGKDNETFKGIYWGYDGTALLCAPPRLYNTIATSIALKEKPITKVEEMARFLALINIALADAGISAWDAKFHFAYARPVTAIRELDADGTPEGKSDPNWTPLGAPVTNGQEQNRNLTPPFPAYPSGHAVFGAALFQTMRRYWGLPDDGVPFKFVSDEYNGRNRGAGDADPRPLTEREFDSFTEAEVENAQSRIWLGIHWQFDADDGITQGRSVANAVFDAVLA